MNPLHLTEPISDPESRSSPPAGGVVTRAQNDPEHHDTAQPSLTSGFGAVIEKERELRVATEHALGQARGTQAAEIDRLLVHQHAALGGAIALLEQRYEALPKPERFVHWHGGSERGDDQPTGDATTRLAALATDHAELKSNIESLIACDPDGQRGELILNEVGRLHAGMAAALATVVGASTDAAASVVKDPTGVTYRAQERWDNEGGPPRR